MQKAWGMPEMQSISEHSQKPMVFDETGAVPSELFSHNN